MRVWFRGTAQPGRNRPRKPGGPPAVVLMVCEVTCQAWGRSELRLRMSAFVQNMGASSVTYGQGCHLCLAARSRWPKLHHQFPGDPAGAHTCWRRRVGTASQRLIFHGSTVIAKKVHF